jgi:hypothetical protein
MEEIYVMGSRLIAFLSVSLPKHPKYHSTTPEISSLREKSLHDLEWIRKRLDVIALRIDEEQLNRFIMEDLESKKKEKNNDDAKPPAIEVSFESEETSSLTANDNDHWESFTGWSLEVSDEENSHVDWNVSGAKDVSFDSHEIMDMSSASLPSGLMDDDDADDPGHVLDLESVSSDDEEQESGDDTFEVSEAIHFKFDTEEDDDASDIDSSFLRAVKSEEVRYESDSEAVDSWAQDSDTSALSLSASPHVSKAYSSEDDDKEDERFALEEIMNKVQSNSPMRISPGNERLLGIHGHPQFNSPAGKVYGADSTPFDEQITPPSPRKKYERRSVLGIRDDLSPDQENKFPYGPTKTVPAEDVTFEMEGIAPRRRVRTDDDYGRNKPPTVPRRRSDMYLSDDSDSEEELITSQGDIAHLLQPYPFYHSR